METTVWIIIAVSFVVGLLCSFVPRRSPFATTIAWIGGIALIAIVGVLMIPAGTPIESTGLAIIGGLGALFGAVALHGLVAGRRKPKEEAV